MQKPWNDCNIETKSYYYPIEAAIRWCGLMEYEPVIREQMGPEDVLPPYFPDWPCLRQRAELILDAMEMGDLPMGRDGRPASDHVALKKRTVRHSDLKTWMEKHHPGQKPSFLFDHIEQNTHPAISADSYHALQADRDAQKQIIDELREKNSALQQKNASLVKENSALNDIFKKQAAPGERSEKTYQHINGALLDFIQGNIPDIETHPSYKSDAQLIEAISSYYDGYPGLSKSNLQRKLPEARRSLESL